MMERGVEGRWMDGWIDTWLGLGVRGGDIHSGRSVEDEDGLLCPKTREMLYLHIMT